VTALQTAVLRWYRQNGRTLPWRCEQDPYRVLVSEVMLQQTQVSRVLEKYPPFLKQFPTLRTLARAERSSVIRAWQGMGYNNRAVRLHLLAQTVVNSYGGLLPRTGEDLILLPGIGRYTACAILSSVFHMPVPVVDVNVHRFFSRLFWPMRTLTEMHSARTVESYALRHLPERRAYDWNQALMDLGATVCTARAPRCTVCPVAKLCRSRTGMKRVAVVQKKQEPSLYGTPDRIYRGRIVECLRGLKDGRTLALETLGIHILPRFSGRNRPWLLKLLNKLERDGLVRLRKGGPTMRVRLS
jgi:A/G-specific adenine glycosylase